MTLQKDLPAAGILYEDASGRVVDFHTLRHTFGTLLSSFGVIPRTAQALMRHSSVDLTMNTYTDPRLLDLAGAVEKLPDLSLESESQELKATGTDGEIPKGTLAPAADFSCPSGANTDKTAGPTLPVPKEHNPVKLKGLGTEKQPLSPPDKNSGRWESNPHNQLGRLGLYR